jgi:hypothetical protein
MLIAGAGGIWLFYVQHNFEQSLLGAQGGVGFDPGRHLGLVLF